MGVCQEHRTVILNVLWLRGCQKLQKWCSGEKRRRTRRTLPSTEVCLLAANSVLRKWNFWSQRTGCETVFQKCHWICFVGEGQSLHIWGFFVSECISGTISSLRSCNMQTFQLKKVFLLLFLPFDLCWDTYIQPLAMSVKSTLSSSICFSERDSTGSLTGLQVNWGLGGKQAQA